MNIDLNTLLVIAGVFTNIMAIIAYANKHERRMTRVETILNILAGRAGLGAHMRSSDSVHFDERPNKNDCPS